MTTAPTPIQPNQPKSNLSKSLEENERLRKQLFPSPAAKKGKPSKDEQEFEKARRQAQDLYMDRLEKQFIQR